MTRRKAIGRRAFLGGAAATAAALPFLQISPLRAQTSVPKRLVIFISPNGVTMNDFWPTGASLSTSPVLAPLAGLEEKLVVLRGLDNAAALANRLQDHWPDFSTMLTGRLASVVDGRPVGSGITVDQHIANALEARTPETERPRYRSLHFRHAYENGGWRPLWRGHDDAVEARPDPYASFDELFGDLTIPEDTLERQRQRRASVLDLVRGELCQMRGALGPEDRHVLDSHVESIREVERTLDPATGAGLSCAPPAIGGRVDIAANDSFPTVARANLQLASAALACDMTRVVTVQIGKNGTNVRPRWIGYENEWHKFGHDGTPTIARQEQTRDIQRWIASELAWLVRSLDSVIEADGTTLLDNTCLVWAHEQADGKTHKRTDFPFVIAGGCQGYFRPNQRVQYEALPTNRLLVTLCQAMGLDTDAFGDARFGSGALHTIAR